MRNFWNNAVFAVPLLFLGAEYDALDDSHVNRRQAEPLAHPGGELNGLMATVSAATSTGPGGSGQGAIVVAFVKPGSPEYGFVIISGADPAFETFWTTIETIVGSIQPVQSSVPGG